MKAGLKSKHKIKARRSTSNVGAPYFFFEMLLLHCHALEVTGSDIAAFSDDLIKDSKTTLTSIKNLLT